MVKLLVFLFFVVTIGVGVHGEQFVGEGCEGKQDREEWTSHKDGDCIFCSCDEDEEVCINCDEEVDVGLPLECYVKKHRDYNPNADYPHCCKREQVLCPDDEGYDEAEREEWENLNVVETDKRKK